MRCEAERWRGILLRVRSESPRRETARSSSGDAAPDTGTARCRRTADVSAAADLYRACINAARGPAGQHGVLLLDDASLRDPGRRTHRVPCHRLLGRGRQPEELLPRGAHLDSGRHRALDNRRYSHSGGRRLDHEHPVQQLQVLLILSREMKQERICRSCFFI